MLNFVYSKTIDFADGDSGIGYGPLPTDSALLGQIREGKGNEDNFGPFDIVFLEAMFGGISPTDDYY